MPIKIIDNKKIDILEEEWLAYRDICKAYERPNFKGSDIFIGLFESDDKGIITFIKPPSTRYTSMEAFLFIVAIYNHQHIRLMEKKMADAIEKMNAEMAKLTGKKS